MNKKCYQTSYFVSLEDTFEYEIILVATRSMTQESTKTVSSVFSIVITKWLKYNHVSSNKNSILFMYNTYNSNSHAIKSFFSGSSVINIKVKRSVLLKLFHRRELPRWESKETLAKLSYHLNLCTCQVAIAVCNDKNSRVN